jgi:hypothetical protein
MVVWCQLGGILFSALAANFWFQSGGHPNGCLLLRWNAGTGRHCRCDWRQDAFALAASCAGVSTFLQAVATYFAMS